MFPSLERKRINEASSGYFLDTNLWLYAFLETKTGNDKQQIARSLINSQGVVVSTQVINEVCVNLIKKALLDEEKINQLIQDFYSRCRVVEFNQQVLLNASKLRQSYSLSFWDSLIVASALEAEVNVLYSEDMQHKLIIFEQLQIVNPFVEGT